MSLEKVTVKEIRFMDGDDTRIYFSNHTQLVGVTSVSCKVSTEPFFAQALNRRKRFR